MTISKHLSMLALPGLMLLVAFAPVPTLASPSTDSPILITADNNSDAAVDNSTVNQRDRASDEPTADQGQNNVNDRDVMQKIRKAVVSDKSLSTYAHNVKIISQNGKVTLKGPVKSDQEKQSIEDKATAVAGNGNVMDQISVMNAD